MEYPDLTVNIPCVLLKKIGAETAEAIYQFTEYSDVNDSLGMGLSNLYIYMLDPTYKEIVMREHMMLYDLLSELYEHPKSVESTKKLIDFIQFITSQK